MFADARLDHELIEGMDKSLGDLLDHLDELGVAENTLVLFLGDNGSDAPLGHQHEVASAAPLRDKKGAHYEGGMRVPFIAAWGRHDEENPHHLATDPFEQRNVAAERPEQLHRLAQELIAELESHEALYPVGENGTPVRPMPPER